MVSKNNLKCYKQRYALYQKPHFGLRKLSVGVASVLLSTTFFLGEAHADEAAETGNNENVTITSNNNVNDTGNTQYVTQALAQNQNNQQFGSAQPNSVFDTSSLNAQSSFANNNFSDNTSATYLNDAKYQLSANAGSSINVNYQRLKSPACNSRTETVQKCKRTKYSFYSGYIIGRLTAPV